jgi:transcriptional regulator with XRE-family HTH domain
MENNMKNRVSILKKTLAKNIRRERKHRGLSQEEFADMVGISPQFISRLENLHNAASMETYMRIADVLELQLSELLIGCRIELTAGNASVNLLGGCSEHENRVCSRVIETILEVIRER